MDPSLDTLVESLVPSYSDSVADARRSRVSLVRNLLAQRRLPTEGWSESSIEMLLGELSTMDTNNFVDIVGVGEREGRIASEIVAKRHFRMVHGVGRSGDIAEIQPKAVGSSLLQKLTHYLVLDTLKLVGVYNTKSCLVVPLATGMAVSLTLQCIRQSRPDAKYVVWPRADQKSCIKAINLAGLVPITIENSLDGDEVATNMGELCRVLDDLNPESICCVISTTACFAPRAPDNVVDIAKECANRGIPHVINNAYGVQSSRYTHLVAEAGRVGRLDAFIQSTDKNFMVPVGGAIIASPLKGYCEEIAKCYPGRASAAPIVDLLITLLSLGKNGYKKLLDERKLAFEHLQSSMKAVADEFSERLLHTPHNSVSMCMSIKSPAIGGMLYRTACSGHRVVAIPASEKEVIPGVIVRNYGAHINDYPTSYIAVSAAIGIKTIEIETFVERLRRVMRDL